MATANMRGKTRKRSRIQGCLRVAAQAKYRNLKKFKLTAGLALAENLCPTDQISICQNAEGE